MAIFFPKEKADISSLANFGNPSLSLCLRSMGIFVTGLNRYEDSFSVRPRREFFFTFNSAGSIGLISEGPTGFVSRVGHGSGIIAMPRRIRSCAIFSGKL